MSFKELVQTGYFLEPHGIYILNTETNVLIEGHGTIAGARHSREILNGYLAEKGKVPVYEMIFDDKVTPEMIKNTVAFLKNHIIRQKEKISKNKA